MSEKSSDRRHLTDRRHYIDKEMSLFMEKILQDATDFLQENFTDLNIENYEYSTDKAIEELGLDDDLVNQLVEDYVMQILKSTATFIEYLRELRASQEKSRRLDYIPLRELAHKNSGVAKNLRIEDGIKILDELMKKHDLDYLEKCIYALEQCAIRLKPKCAYETLKLIKVKSSL